MAKNEVAQIHLRRLDTSQAWGFRMKGGAQEGKPLFIEGVARNGRAAQSGLHAGDVIVMIGNTNCQHFSHDQAKAEMLRCGNELDLTVIKRAMARPRPPGVNSPAMASPVPNSPSPVVSNSPAPQPIRTVPEQRVQVVEEPIAKLGGPTYKDVKPKTYQVLQEELPAAEQGAGRPASIFDRKREERSDYLQANQSTIQKAYGQTH